MSNKKELARQIAVMTAYMNGQKIECKAIASGWTLTCNPQFDWLHMNYRVRVRVRVKESKRYKLGSLFYDKEFGPKSEKYILCQVTAETYCLVSLAKGNRWSDPVKEVLTNEDHEARSNGQWDTISEASFKRVCGSTGSVFVEVSK